MGYNFIMNKILQYKNMTIRNFKSILEVNDISLTGRIIPIVGINGAGKSNVLRALNWYYGNSDESIEVTRHKDLRNKYHCDDNDVISVEVTYSVTSTDKSDFNKIRKVLNEILGNDFKEYYLSIGISDEFEYDEYMESIIKKFNKSKEIIIRKTLTSNNQEIYHILSEIELEYESKSDCKSAQTFLSDLIYQRIIIEHTPKIEFFDTKKIIEEFHKKNNDMDANEDEDKTSSLSFKNLFSWTPFESKSNKKFKIIESILKSTASKYTFEDFVEMSIASSEAPNIMNRDIQEQIYKLQDEFNDSISKNGFFTSINSNSKVNIFPSYELREDEEYEDTDEIEIDDEFYNEDYEEIEDGNQEEQREFLKLTIFDEVKTRKGIKQFEIEDISFKNDGFIFALILFLFIEYLLDDESIILIDEPANFLSDTSVKLLMENFERISKNREIKFIFTTHSHQTLRKDIVNIDDIKIAQKDEMFNTIINNVSDIKTNSEEFSIINYEYSEKPSGSDLIRLKFNGDENSIYKNLLLDIKNDHLNRNLINFINYILGNKLNVIPSFNIELTKQNTKRFSEIKNSDESCIEEPLKFNILNNKEIEIFNLFDTSEIKQQVGQYELTTNGAVNNFKLDSKDPLYIRDLVLLIFRHHEDDFKKIQKEMSKSSDNIIKEFEKNYV